MNILQTKSWGQYIDSIANWSLLSNKYAAPFCPVFFPGALAQLALLFPSCVTCTADNSWRAGLPKQPDHTDATRLPNDADDVAWRAYSSFLAHKSGCDQDDLKAPAALATVSQLKVRYERMAELLADNDRSLVLAFAGSFTAPAAAAYSIATGSPFLLVASPKLCPELISELKSPRTAIFCDTQTLTDNWFAGFPATAIGQIGLVPCLNQATASLIAAKLVVAQQQTQQALERCVYVDMDRTDSDSGGQVEILGRDKAHIEPLQRALNSLSGSRTLLVINSHGYEDRVFLGSESIQAELEPSEQNSGLAPESATLGVDQLKAGLLVFDTCLGAQTAPSLIKAGLRLGTQALAGYSHTYISTSHVKDYSWVECCLFYNLIFAGYFVGEVVEIVNRWLEVAELDYGCYVLFGDPALRWRPQPIHNQRVNIAAGATVFTVAPGNVSLVALALVGVPAGQLPYVFTADDVASNTFFYALLPSGPNTATLYIFAWRAFNKATLTLHTTYEEPIYPQLRETLADLPNLLQRLEQCGVHTQIIKGLVKSMENELEAVAHIAPKCRYDLHSYGELGKKQNLLLQHINNAELKLVNKLVDKCMSRSWAFNEGYRKVFRVRDAQLAAARCSCGQQLVCKHLAHSISHTHERFVFQCPACGVICDSPDQLLTAQLFGPTTVEAGRSYTFELKLARRSGAAANTVWKVCVEGEQRLGSWIIEPRETALLLTGKITAHLTVQVPLTIPKGRYFLKGFALMNMQVVYFAHQFLCE